MTTDTRLEEAPAEGLQQSRVEIEVPVAIVGTSEGGSSWTERTVVENVTRRGAFIRTERRVNVGDVLAVHDADDTTLTLGTVEVVWIRPAGETPPGVGVKLVDDDNARWIRYLVERSAPDGDGPPVSD
jgi:hypothetical protein